jgi:hypothetical protein
MTYIYPGRHERHVPGLPTYTRPMRYIAGRRSNLRSLSCRTITSSHERSSHDRSFNSYRHLQIVGKLSRFQRNEGRQIPSTQRNEARLSTAFIDTSRVALARVSIRATASITTSIVTSAGVAVFGTITRTTSFFQTLLVAWRHRCNSTEPSRLTLESCTTARHSFGTSTCTAVFTIVATLDMN